MQAQEYLDRKYRNSKRGFSYLSIRSEKLRGHLDLNAFSNLSNLSLPYNELTSINIDSLRHLTSLNVSENKLTSRKNGKN